MPDVYIIARTITFQQGLVLRAVKVFEDAEKQKQVTLYEPCTIFRAIIETYKKFKAIEKSNS